MTQAFFWIGGIAILLLALSEIGGRFSPWYQTWKQARAVRKMNRLDWTLIDNTVNSERPRRDCERQESLGICTGKECLVYENCDFNIKKIIN